MQRRQSVRALSLALPRKEQPQIVVEGTSYPVHNFNALGMGLRLPASLKERLLPGTPFSTLLHVDAHSYPVKLHILYSQDGYYGLAFDNIGADLSKLLRQFTAPFESALHLQPHSENGKIDPSTGFARAWYVHPPHSELVVWYNDLHQLIMQIQVCFEGFWIFRTAGKPIEGGKLEKHSGLPQGKKIPTQSKPLGTEAALQGHLQRAIQFLVALPPPWPGALLWHFLEKGEPFPIPLVEKHLVPPA